MLYAYRYLLCVRTFFTASFVKTACATELATITCHNDSKIFIESVSYGRTDNVTCLAPNQEIPSCNASIDLSWRVLPYCQGLSSCVVNGSYDGTVVPCDGNGTNYFNISYHCKISKLETLFATYSHVEGWYAHKKLQTHNCKESKLTCYFEDHGQEWRIALQKISLAKMSSDFTGFAILFSIARVKKSQSTDFVLFYEIRTS